MQKTIAKTAFSLFTFLWIATASLVAQGVTTGAVICVVTDASGKPVGGAQVEVVNRTTGYRTGTLTRANGLYLVQGLEVGGPYTVRVQSIGVQAPERTDVFVSLSQSTRVDFRVEERAVQLGALEVVTARTTQFSPTSQGVANVVTDSMLRRMPSLSRDIPRSRQAHAAGHQGAGPERRPQRGRAIQPLQQLYDRRRERGRPLQPERVAGAPGSAASARLLSVEAVKEFRVALSPTNVRQGNFTGMLVNAVTKNGTNELHGSGTVVFRNEALAGKIPGPTPGT